MPSGIVCAQTGGNPHPRRLFFFILVTWRE
jgi:hypothetical protein